jgi:hypothetical protein
MAAATAISEGATPVASSWRSVCSPQLGIGLVVYAGLWAIIARRAALWVVCHRPRRHGRISLCWSQWPAAMVRQVLDYLALPISLSPVARLAESIGIGSFGTLAISGGCCFTWCGSGGFHPGDERRFLWTMAMTQAILLVLAPSPSPPTL